MLTLEPWALLILPLFFALGWIAARIDIKHVVADSRRLPKAYFQGLNFLLNEQPDRAIEAFNEVVRVDPETVELHFALGSLFRRRGELERALRIHQNLMNREDLPQPLKEQALFELGIDYLKSGLLDRSEEIFKRLSEGARREEALKQLLEIYQLEKSWDKAIELAEKVPDLASQHEVAEFWCEMAENALIRSRTDEARRHVQQALSLHRQCVRASIIAGDIERKEGHAERAIEAWLRIEQQQPEFLSLVAARIAEVYKGMGRQTDGMQLLKGFLTRYPSVDILDVVCQQVVEEEGAQAAYDFALAELHRTPSLIALDKALEARAAVTPAEQLADLDLVKKLIKNQTQRLSRYTCKSCGFKARQFYWRCPACSEWESYPPKRSEEFSLVQ